MADVQQEIEEQQPAPVADTERDVAFYAAALDAFYATSLEYDKSILTLAAGGLGLLVTLLTTVGLTSLVELVAYLLGIVAFTVTLGLLLWTFLLNKSHIIAVVGGDDELSTRQLKVIDRISKATFGAGIVCAAVVGVLTAINSYETKVKAMTDSKKPSAPIVRQDSVQGVKKLRPDVLNESFVDASKLRPKAASGASASTTAKTAASSTAQASTAAPTAPTSNPTTTKGK
ncbi:hypothetical protein [Burkholderia pseudomallei]|uniref:hypothetical protein n=1 Tax=Burkholderia pseudomallei TaxID=28450 RepID=UPI0009780AA5|nr:hypothetical protein [Burkholderia pseudomallei]OMS07601.1 hypothetical protein AQ736_03495 [Burkholderia pseudomallei]OMS96406.1 hypothetical protein AQ750_04535 [Burkholderia pseudomallei]OMV28864.1 hypothetical protein AQ787_11850 [Burkholderia pseudomallei]CAJ3488059.1 Uncharacterised protein [Burkholderia pseudomallei]CAJ4178434.1 Uncharacterised protein [Burkholderia pseudomallei]